MAIINDFNLDGKVAIITGAGRGLGRATALTFSESGADIVAVSRTKKELEQTADAVRQLGHKCLTLVADIANANQVENLVSNTLSEFGRVDILVNNAGFGSTKAIIPTPGLEKLHLAKIAPDFNIRMTDEEWDCIWNTNVRGVFYLINAVVPAMIKQGRGKIINITSSAVVRETIFQGIYPATKAAVAVLTRCLANELARFKINVNAIGPGMFKTVMIGKLLDDQEASAALLKKIPLRRFGDPREVGLLAVYLASDASNYMTGQSLYIDGGYIIS